MGIIREVFGHDSHGATVYSYTVTNDHGTRIRLIEMGAALQSLEVADRDGNFADVVLGYDNVAQYETANGENFGVVVGRNANRIKDARFMIKGKEYKLAKNSGENNLHSGPDGYSSRRWESEIADNERGQAVRFSLVSPDGDQGMPGELHVSVTYILTDDDSVILEYEGVAGDDTIVNLTNHSYFNLAGHASGTVYDQKMWLAASEFTPSDASLIPTGEYRSVKGTPMDFTEPKAIGEDINADYEPLIIAGGYDHNFVLDNKGEVELAGSLYDEKSGRFMEVFTQMPGIQIYTGNFLSGKVRGKDNCCYGRRSGVCFESQFFPDSVNNMAFESPVAKAGVPFDFVTIYKFSVK